MAGEKFNRQSGITIVEVLVAMLVFGIAIGGFASLALTMKQAGDGARDHYQAVHMAKNRLERARNVQFELLPMLSEDDVLVGSDGNPDPNGFFRRSTIVSNVAPDLYEISCTIEIKNRLSLQFEPALQSVKTLITDMSQEI
jgi:type II secretory pathway pseudopilin PulG